MSSQSVALLCHPATPADGVRGVEVHVFRSAKGVLRLAYRLDADVTRIVIPPPRPAGIAHGLWEHTCFEAFIGTPGSEAYHELNFSPSGEWAAYAFRAYREPAGLIDEALAPPIGLRTAEDLLELEASVSLDRIEPGYVDTSLHLGLSAVLEHDDDTISYWSLAHPPGRPDFHHHSTRTLVLAALRRRDTKRR